MTRSLVRALKAGAFRGNEERQITFNASDGSQARRTSYVYVGRTFSGNRDRRYLNALDMLFAMCIPPTDAELAKLFKVSSMRASDQTEILSILISV